MLLFFFLRLLENCIEHIYKGKWGKIGHHKCLLFSNTIHWEYKLRTPLLILSKSLSIIKYILFDKIIIYYTLNFFFQEYGIIQFCPSELVKPGIHWKRLENSFYLKKKKHSCHITRKQQTTNKTKSTCVLSCAKNKSVANFRHFCYRSVKIGK